MATTADDVIDAYGSGVARIAASYERDPALREELLQEMLIAIISALPRLRDPSRIKPYVFRIAHNRAMRHIAQQMREPRSAAEPDELAGDLPNQEQRMIADERSIALLEAVRQLPLSHRQVITLLLEDLTYPEIAEALGISTNNVGVRINRAKQQLRDMLYHDR